MIRAKVLGENTLKGCQSQRATFSDVYLVKTELKSNDLRIQAFALKKPYIVYMCIVQIHEMNITSINKIKQGRIYNLGQNLLRHITKIPIFALKHDKNAFSRKLKDRFSPPLLQCCFRCTLGLLSQNNINCTRGGELGEFGQDGCMERN